MSSKHKSANETERLNALYEYDILDSIEEKEYDDLVQLLSYICQAPVAFISFIDSHRQWFKAAINIDTKEVPIEETVCQYTILQENIVEIPNLIKDKRFENNRIILENQFVSYAGIPLTTSQGYHLGTVCVLDRKERLLNEEQKKALRILANQTMSLLELRIKNKKLTRQNQEISHHKDYQNKVLGLISHDLRSPLIQAIGFTEVLSHSFSDEENLNLLIGLKKNAQNALFMLDETLSWAKMQMNGFLLQKVDFTLEDVVKEILEQFDDKIKYKQIVFNYRLPVNASIYTDKFIFGSIIRNLLSNAIKFTPRQGVVSLEISLEENNYLQIIVRDFGIGMSQNTIENILNNKPIEAQKGTEGEKGAGIGIQILKDFVVMLQGRMLVESEKNKGTTFTIILPQH